MSEHIENQVPEEEQDFIASNEVDQEVIADDENMMEEDEDDDEIDNDIDQGAANGEIDGNDDVVEIDMSNNSVGYFDKHTDSIFTVFCHPNLPLVCSGGGDNIAHLWTSHSNPPKFAGSVAGHTESVIAGSFTSDGLYLVTADMTGKVLVHKSTKGGSQWVKKIELQEVEEVVWLKCHPTIPNVFAFGATDGSVWCYQIDPASESCDLLLSGQSHQLDCTMGEFIGIDQGENVLNLVTVSLDSTIVGWNCYTGQLLFKVTKDDIKGLEAQWVSISAAPVASKLPVLACGSNNGILAIINFTNGAVLSMSRALELKPEQEELDASIESIAWAETFSLMAVGLVCGDVLIYDTATWRVRRRFTLEDSVTRLVFDQNDLFVSCINGKVYQYDARTVQEKYVCTGHHMGVLDFVLIHSKDANAPRRLITAGDESVSLVFEVPN